MAWSSSIRTFNLLELGSDELLVPPGGFIVEIGDFLRKHRDLGDVPSGLAQLWKNSMVNEQLTRQRVSVQIWIASQSAREHGGWEPNEP